MLSGVGFFMAAPPGSVQLGSFLDYGRISVRMATAYPMPPALFVMLLGKVL